MKTIHQLLLLVTISTLGSEAFGQSNNPTLGILDFSVSGINFDPSQPANVARAELTKLERYVIYNREDIRYELDRKGIPSEECYAKACLIEVGKQVNLRKMFSGSVEAIDGRILVSLRLIDVGSGQEDLSFAKEYLNLPDQVPLIIQYAVREMYGQDLDEDILDKLTRKDHFESSITMPQTTRLNLSGPRMGLTFFAGELGKVMASDEDGGFDASNIMFQFGYQFEATYLNEGNFQALFEFVPLITGFDQGKFFPSISVLNGLRDSHHGWELALGPTFSLTRIASGYFDDAGKFIVDGPVPDGFKKEKRVDSRGSYAIRSAFVVSVGKSFRSGNLNLPINFFYVPGKDGNHRFGLSVGYNTRQS